jgi:hypothetical protein
VAQLGVCHPDTAESAAMIGRRGLKAPSHVKIFVPMIDMHVKAHSSGITVNSTSIKRLV